MTGGAEGHVSRDCSAPAKAKSCYKCGQEGHIVRRVILLAFKVPDVIHAFSSPETALKLVTLRVVGATAAAAAEVALAPSAISVARSAILPVRALRLPLEEEEGETTARSVVDPKRLGRFFFGLDGFFKEEWLMVFFHRC